MARITIRNLDDSVMERLRARAAKNGRSVAAEVRAILTEAVAEPDTKEGLFGTLHRRFAELGGVELDLPPRN